MIWGMLTVTALVGSLVVAGTAYPSMAASKGWPIGSWAYSDKWALFYLVGAATTIVSSWNYGGLLGIAVVIVSAWVLALLLTQCAGRHTQVLALLSLPIAVPWFAASFWLK